MISFFQNLFLVDSYYGYSTETEYLLLVFQFIAIRQTPFSYADIIFLHKDVGVGLDVIYSFSSSFDYFHSIIL